MNRTEHQKGLYVKFISNESFQREISGLRHILKGSIWSVSEDGKKIANLGGPRINCPRWAKRRYGKRCCERTLQNIAGKARRTKNAVRFDCGSERFGTCMPIAQGDRIYGYIFVCNSNAPLQEDTIGLFSNFIDTLTRELQKEFELAKLYRTIRPRAIALSTIHTVHRIISSSLNPDELLPRLARLCLQVFRVERCSIILKEKGRKPTIVSAAAQETKKRPLPRRIITRKRLLTEGRMCVDKSTLCYPLANDEIMGAICVSGKTDKTKFNEFDIEIMKTLSEQAGAAIKNARLYKEQEDMTLGSIKSLAALLNTRTGASFRVRGSAIRIAMAIGRQLGLKSDELRNLHYAVLLHDAGQIAFPDKLLTKADKLTGKEYSLIKRHPGKSVSIIKHLAFLKPVIPIILHHHENYDGSGYPKGLKGGGIPLGARIMAVVSAFNAMVTKRPYRKKIDVNSAVAEIKKNSGTQFDPTVIKAFLKAVKEDDISQLLQRGL